MCIIVVNRKKPLSRETFVNCWTENPDGFGMSYSEGGKLHTVKRLIGMNEAFDIYHAVRQRAKGAILLHFRIATHGSVNIENCHPFDINPSLAIAHNGVINIRTTGDQSDTRQFVKDVLRKLPNGFLKNQGITSLLSLSIGSSKLAFLDCEGRYTIIGEKQGIWEGGNWYSNHTYKPIAARYLDWRFEREIPEGYNFDGPSCEFCGEEFSDLQYVDGSYVCQDCLIRLPDSQTIPPGFHLETL